MSNEITIGADPEFFVETIGNGEARAICGMLGGTKEAPIPLLTKPEGVAKASPIGKGYTLQEDNVMVEFNVPPTNNAYDFCDTISRAQRGLNDVHLRPLGLQPKKAASFLFPNKELESRQAMVFGCAPDFDAYRDGAPHERIKPDTLKDADGAWRFAGGHIHLGYKAELPEFVVAHMADIYLGLLSVQMGEKQGKRRELYGQAGRFRPTKYGIEYRTLSNWWLWNNRNCFTLANAAQQLLKVITTTTVDRLQAIYADIPWVDVQTAINTENQRLATRLYKYIQKEILE